MTDDPAGGSPAVEAASQLSPADTAAVLALVEDAADGDGFAALNEQALLVLRHHRPARHLLHRGDDGSVLAYAQLDGGVAQLVVDPPERRRGLGVELVRALQAESPRELRIWAMGDTPAASALARRTGLVVGRELLVMARPLTDPLPVPPVPPGLAIRTFVPGQDEPAWLEVNARAFASHPEQGAVTAVDLAERMAEPWFDPAGFFVAVEHDSGALVGFHWTKQHEDSLGEVYVLGVDPRLHSRGLGKALLATGLEHLRHRGDTMVELYVEASEAGPVGLYRAYGFTVRSRDVMYEQPRAGVHPD